jgi:uncharacterized protein
MILQEDIERTLVALKPTLSARFYVDKIGYFGSVARNEHNDNSDIDIIVSFHKPLGWAFFDLQEFLEKELNRKVDLVSINGIKEQLKDIILNEVKYVGTPKTGDTDIDMLVSMERIQEYIGELEFIQFKQQYIIEVL